MPPLSITLFESEHWIRGDSVGTYSSHLLLLRVPYTHDVDVQNADITLPKSDLDTSLVLEVQRSKIQHGDGKF